MKNMTLSNIAMVCGGIYHGPEDRKEVCVSSISTDSRYIKPGALFAAIPGERVDGHDFIPSAFGKGAICCISERILENPAGVYIQVESTLEAMKKLGAFYRMQINIPVVGITGSVGKTSTKEMIASVLSQKFCILKTNGNFNNELGLPLTVFRIREEHQIAILEMGISNFDEMHRLSEIAKPDVAVITNIGPCHLENLGDRTGVLKAKTEIFDFLAKNGSVILNGDDDKLATIQHVHGKPVIYFGLGSKNAVYADHIENKGLKGVSCTIYTGNASFDVDIPIPGIHMVYNALAAAAVGSIFGMEPKQIKMGIEAFKPAANREHIIERNGYFIIDDCYNANPASMKAAIDVLKGSVGRTVAILGDMGELGVNERKLHEEVGAYCVKAGIDVLACAGSRSRSMAAAAAEEARIHGSVIQISSFSEKSCLLAVLPRLVQKGDTILVKASRFMGFEDIVNAL